MGVMLDPQTVAGIDLLVETSHGSSNRGIIGNKRRPPLPTRGRSCQLLRSLDHVSTLRAGRGPDPARRSFRLRTLRLGHGPTASP